MQLLRLVGRYARQYPGLLVTVLILQTVSTFATLYLPRLNADIIDKGVSLGDIGYIWSTGGVMIAVAFVQVITAVAATWCAARLAMSVGRDIRRDVYRSVDRFSSQDMGTFGVPTLITRGTNDVQQVQMVFVMFLSFMVTMPIMCIGGIVMALREDAGLSWLVWVSVAVLLVIVGLMVARLVPLFGSMQERIDAINGVMREQITGIRVIRAFVREKFETKRFEDANQAVAWVSERVGRVFVLMGPVIMLVLHAATAAVLWFGGHRVADGAIEVGSLTAFMQYLLQILVAVMMGSFMAMMLPRAIVCAGRIQDVLGHEPSIVEPESDPSVETVSPGEVRGELEFRDVSFTYPGADAPVLTDISFTVRPGETTAVIGATGSGKTTMVNLIMRFYEVTSGAILVDGVDTRTMSRAELRSRTGMVLQDAVLFDGTILENIRYGRLDATDDEVKAAAKAAYVDRFVHALPEGYDTVIDQDGGSVSAGERQLITIARAFLAEPEILILDEATSSVDTRTEVLVQKAMNAIRAQRTSFVIAHRLSTIRAADRILVMVDGSIVEQGSHDELLEVDGSYAELYRSQFAAGGAV